MPLLATDMVFHFDLNPFGSLTVFALFCSALCWVAVEVGLPSPNPRRKIIGAMAPFGLLFLYLLPSVTGSLRVVLARAHVTGWNRVFSAEECLAIYVLLAVAAVTAVRVARAQGFRVAGSIQLTLAVAFFAREFILIWQWYSWANEVT